MKAPVCEEEFFSTKDNTFFLGEVFVEYLGPQLLTCQDKYGTNYLCVASGWFEDKTKERWVLVKITPTRLQEILTDKTTLYEAFTKPEDGQALIIEQDVKTLVETEKTIPASELDDEWLPTPGFYLKLDETEEDEI